MFSSFSPMLAQRMDFDSFPSLMEGSQFYLENKLDGYRIQIHKDGNAYRYFSRNAHDYSNLFGSSSTDGSLSCRIHDLFKDTVNQVILDGEMMVYDEESDNFLAFGKLIGVSKAPILDALKDGNQKYRPCFVAFDIVYLNGVSMVNSPLHKRIQVLETDVLKEPVRGTLELIKRTKGTSLDHVKSALDEAIGNFEEGLVLKKVNSLYDLGSRSKSWLKIKPEYIDGLVEDLDLLVVGCSYGKRQTGLVSTFYLALLKEESNLLVTFAKVGSGYSSKELKELK